MKLNIILCLGMIAAFSAVISTGSLALAQSPSPAVLAAEQLTTAEKIAKVKKVSLAEIKKRQTALDRLSDKISKNTRISSDDKQDLIAEIQNNIAELNKLESKITLDTDLAILRNDRKLVKLLRISGVLMPRVQGEFASFKFSATLQKITSVLDRVQNKVNGAGDTTKAQINPLITSAKAKIQSAKSNNDNALLQFRLATVQNYPVGSKAALQKGKGYLDDARKDLKSAGEDIKQIILLLKTK